MKHRFRYLNERGQQVEVKDLTSLREHVRSGRVDDETLLYDSLTDEWAPAAAHSAYRLLDDPLARGSDAGKDGADDAIPEGPPGQDSPPGSEGVEGEEAASPSAGGSDFDFPDLGVTLAPDDAIESADEVVERLLKEREREGDVHRLPPANQEFSPPPEKGTPDAPSDHDPAPDLWGPDRRPPMPRIPAPDDEPIRLPDRRPRSAGASAEPSEEASRGTSVRRPRGRSSSRHRGAGEETPAWRRVEVSGRLVALSAVLIGVLGLYAGTRLMGPSGSAEASTRTDSADVTVRRPSNSTWAAAEGGAFRDMLDGVDRLRTEHGVERIPPVWLGGPYLADADRFPEIREYWENYGRFVDAVRSRDMALFRQGFVDRLENQGIEGPIASIRLARALETFNASQPARDTVYERMEDLAGSALDLHELLVERSDDLVYDPVTEERASRQPILEAWSDDPYLRETLWALLDRITANLALLENGAGSGRSDLTERLFQELRTRSVAPTGSKGSEGGG